MIAQSNAAIGKQAKEATKQADALSAAAGDADDWKAHEKAGYAHEDAAWKNRQAGNSAAADKHKKMASTHLATARPGREMSYAAENMSREANALSVKAEKRQFGKDDDDLRDGKELHEAAATMHDKASQAHKLAGCKVAAAYHAAKSTAHKEAAGG